MTPQQIMANMGPLRTLAIRALTEYKAGESTHFTNPISAYYFCGRFKCLVEMLLEQTDPLNRSLQEQFDEFIHNGEEVNLERQRQQVVHSEQADTTD